MKDAQRAAVPPFHAQETEESVVLRMINAGVGTKRGLGLSVEPTAAPNDSLSWRRWAYDSQQSSCTSM